MAVFTVVNNADAGSGSLREAITLANTSPSADTIAFNINNPQNDLTIGASVGLAGHHRYGRYRWPLPAELRRHAGRRPERGGAAGADGLRFTAGGNKVRSLTISNFSPNANSVGGRGSC